MNQQQTLRFATTPDGVRLAWATAGSGPALVKASNWVTHLEYDWESLAWRHWLRFLTDHFSLTRYDERGCGLSQRSVDDVSQRHWLPDMETIITAARPQEPFVLLGISQGACAAIEFAARYPDRVSQLLLYGAYARGWAKRSNPDIVREGNALVELIGLGWGRDDPLYRRLFTQRFLPGGSQEQLDWFDQLCRQTISPEIAVKLFLARGEADITQWLPRVQVPTLVAHARGDQVAPFGHGQLLAAEIPNAQFLPIDSDNHVLLEDEPGWQRFQDAVLEFTGAGRAAAGEAFAALSDREREILTQLAAGLTNAQIGEALFISEKTVRNNLTRIFQKLGVSNRAQAIAHARDHGFEG